MILLALQFCFYIRHLLPLASSGRLLKNCIKLSPVLIIELFKTEMLSRAGDYSILILKAGPNYSRSGAEKIIWEHGKRNFFLRARELLTIVCPITDKSDLDGIGIFNVDVEETKSIMDQDPAVKRASSSMRRIPAGAFPETACRKK